MGPVNERRRYSVTSSLIGWADTENHPCDLKQVHGAVASQDIPWNLILNSNLAKSRLSISYFSVVKSFWNFAHSTTVLFPCSVQNFETIWQLKYILWINEISQHLSWRRVFGGVSFTETARWADENKHTTEIHFWPQRSVSTWSRTVTKAVTCDLCVDLSYLEFKIRGKVVTQSTKH